MSRKIILIALIILILAGIAGWAIIYRSNNTSKVVIPISDKVSLRLGAILTKDNSELDMSSWSRRMVNKLPHGARDFLANALKIPYSAKLQTFMQPQGIQLVFFPQYPASWNKTKTEKEISEALTEAIKDSNITNLRLRYKKGSYSQSLPLEYSSNNLAPSYDYAVHASFSDVPANLKTFDLLQIKNGKSYNTGGPFQGEIASFDTLKNPCYREVAPLDNPIKLPASVTHGAVTVKLSSLVTKTISGDTRRRKFDESYLEMRKRGKFYRAEGTPEDPFYSQGVLEISESGTTRSQWDVEMIKGYYSKDLIPYGGGNFWLSSGPDGLVFGFMRDLGILQQPIKLSVSLVHDSNLGADELKVVEMAIPPKGVTVAGDGKTIHFWDQFAQIISISNGKITTASPSNPFTYGVPGRFSIAFSSQDKIKLKDVRFRNETDKVSIVKYSSSSGSGSTTSNHKMSQFFDFNLSRTAFKEIPIKIEDYTTVTLVLASPKIYPDTFDFIVQPTEATIPAPPLLKKKK